MKNLSNLKLSKEIITCSFILIITIFMIVHKENTQIVHIDKDYLYALNTADRYLYAWIMRDGSIAYSLISDNIKNDYIDQKDFQIQFAGVSNPHHQAFEIIGYKRLSKDRICFKVWYYEDYTAVIVPTYKRTRPSLLELVKIDNKTWLVDKME